MKKIFALQFLLVTAALFTVGCSSGKDDNKASDEVVPPDVSEYSKASCLYKYEEGDRAQAKGSNDVRITYFKKKLNLALLAPVLGASSGETVRFAESQNVRFYKTSVRDANNCEMTQDLPSAPSDLGAEFSRLDTQGSILGLYLGANTKNLPSTSPQAAVLVRRDTNKWVLVHEYLHHLFQIQRDADVGVETEDVKARLTRVGQEYDQAVSDLKADNSATRAAKLKIASQKLVEFNIVAFDFLRQYLLEEMSIENVMAEKLARYELKYVVEGQRVNGAAYTISSGKKAKELVLRNLESENQQFLLRNMLELANEDHNSVNKVNFEIQSISSEIDSLTSSAKSYLLSKGLEFKGLSSVMGIVGSTQGHVGCAHQQGMDEVEEFFKQRQ